MYHSRVDDEYCKWSRSPHDCRSLLLRVRIQELEFLSFYDDAVRCIAPEGGLLTAVMCPQRRSAPPQMRSNEKHAQNGIEVKYQSEDGRLFFSILK